MFERIRHLKLSLSKKMIFIIIPAVILIGLALFVGYRYFLVGRSRFSPVAYGQTYALTEDKISQSAPIKVHLPKDVDKIQARDSIKFSP
ncbi:MAG: hypothetical protein Q8L21_02870, partial [Candidatus Komeilibacteria bacterium]|nr:hypothetical protein [Candidatus Komeilibacteria bacterium]